MTHEEKISWLSRYREAEKLYQRLSFRLAEAQEATRHITQNLSAAPGGSKDGQSLARAVEREEEAERRAYAQLAVLDALFAEIDLPTHLRHGIRQGAHPGRQRRAEEPRRAAGRGSSPHPPGGQRPRLHPQRHPVHPELPYRGTSPLREFPDRNFQLHIHNALLEGDVVVLARIQKGKRYVVLDRISPIPELKGEWL